MTRAGNGKDRFNRFREPSFIVIGSQKSGTSMLFYYLCQHPHISPPVRKEVHYFDANYHMGLQWYRSHFPPVKLFPQLISGEATPYYIFHPLAAQRLHETFPHIKLIVILKNPIDRAYSHFQHNRRREREERSFETALAEETHLLKGEKEKLLQVENYFSENYKYYSYKERGIYINQLEQWNAHFPKEQFHIIETGQLFTSPLETMNQLFQFLERDPYTVTQSHKRNHPGYPPMKPGTRQQLARFFAPYNRQLYRFLQREFYWQ